MNRRANGTHVTPDVAAALSGRSVVVWEDDSDANDWGQIRMAIFDPQGKIIGSEIDANQIGGYHQWEPRVSMSPSGEHIAVTFLSNHLNPSRPPQVMVARFSDTGSPGSPAYTRVGSDVQVSKILCKDGGSPPGCGQAPNPNSHADVSINDSGRYVVVYRDDNDGNGAGQIRGVIYSGAGSEIARKTINQHAAGDQARPSVGISSDDRFVVSWEEPGGGDQWVMVRPFWGNGTPMSLDLPSGDDQMPVYEGAYSQENADIAFYGQTMVVTWEQRTSASSPVRIASIMYDLTGNGPYSFDQYGGLEISTTSQTGPQKDPRISIGTELDYAVVWSDDRDGNNAWQVRASTYDWWGAPIVKDKTINAVSHRDQVQPAVALPGGKKVLSVWTDYSGDWPVIPTGASKEPQVHRRLTGLDLVAPSAPSAEPAPGESDLGDDFTLAVIPDSQYYTLRAGGTFTSADDGLATPYPDTYNRMANWIVRHEDEANIRGVIHVGDVTNEAGEKPSAGGDSEWEIAKVAHRRMKNIPTAMVPGNHDYRRPGTNGVNPASSDRYFHYYGVRSQREASGYNTFVDEAEVSAWVVDTQEEGSYENNYTYVSSQGSEADLLLLNLEYAPRKDALCWAADVVRNNPEKRAIVTTHSHLSSTTHAKASTGDRMVGRDAIEVVNEFVLRHSNVLLVLSGHIGGENHMIENRDWLTSGANHPGYQVHQVLNDYQFEKAGSSSGKSYGNGWFRTLTFSPNEQTIWSNVHTVLRGDKDIFFDIDDGGKSSIEPLFNDGRMDDGTPGWKDPSHPSHTFPIPYSPEFSAGDYEEDLCFGSGFADRTVDVTWHPDSLGTEQPFLVEPDIARFSDGSFIVTWEADPDGNGYTQARARFFSENGCETAPATTVNLVASGNQRKPRVWIGGQDQFVVVWTDDRYGGAKIMARPGGWDAQGSLTWGSEFVLVDGAVDLSDEISLHGIADISNGGGEFALAWADPAGKIQVQQWALDGALQILDLQNRTELAGGRAPGLTVNANGDVLVGWLGALDLVQTTVWDGASSTPIESAAEGAVPPLALWLDDAGRGLVAWTDSSGERIRAMRVDGSDDTIFDLVPDDNNALGGPSIAGAPDGTLALVWHEVRQEVQEGKTFYRREIRAAGYAALPASGPPANTLPGARVSRKYSVSSAAEYLEGNSFIFNHSGAAAALAPADPSCGCATCPPKLFVVWEANEYSGLYPGGLHSNPDDLEEAMFKERRIMAKGLPF